MQWVAFDTTGATSLIADLSSQLSQCGGVTNVPNTGIAVMAVTDASSGDYQIANVTEATGAYSVFIDLATGTNCINIQVMATAVRADGTVFAMDSQFNMFIATYDGTCLYFQPNPDFWLGMYDAYVRMCANTFRDLDIQVRRDWGPMELQWRLSGPPIGCMSAHEPTYTI